MQFDFYLPNIVFGWAVKSVGSTINRVLSTTRVIRSSPPLEATAAAAVAVAEEPQASLYCWLNIFIGEII